MHQLFAKKSQDAVEVVLRLQRDTAAKREMLAEERAIRGRPLVMKEEVQLLRAFDETEA